MNVELTESRLELRSDLNVELAESRLGRGAERRVDVDVLLLL